MDADSFNSGDGTDRFTDYFPAVHDVMTHLCSCIYDIFNVFPAKTGVEVATILVVDDEPNIREVVGLYLRRDGHTVILAADGEEALQCHREHSLDLIVLDLMLPKLSGFEVCRRIHAQQYVPLIMLTAKGDEEDRIIGLGIGADDYLVKPFSPRELVARVTAVLRRTNGTTRNQTQRKTITSGELSIDPNTRVVTVGGAQVALTLREFDLLYYLANEPQRSFTRDQLMEAVWGYAAAKDVSTVTVHIRRLREKIERDPTNPRYLLTVWGFGYRFASE